METMRLESESGVSTVEWVIVVALVTASVFWIYPTLETHFDESAGQLAQGSGENQATLADEMGVDLGQGGAAPVAPPPYVPPFKVLPSGGIQLTGPASPKISILGSAITYGAGGPQVPVSLDVNIDGVPMQVFKGKGSEVTPTSGQELNSLPEGTLLHFQGKSFHPTKGNTLYTQSTSTFSKMVIPLRNGDLVPDKTPFDQQPQIQSFLAEVIDPTTKVVTIEENQVLYLVELGTNNTSSPAADFQDLVFLATF